MLILNEDERINNQANGGISLTDKKKKVSQVAVLDKAFTIIFFLKKTKEGIGLTEIARQTGINKTTCYRILQTLMTNKIVEYGTSSGTYRLGLNLLELGNAVQRRISIREIALPYLKELTNKTTATTYLCLLRNDKSLCVERIEGPHAQILLLNVGEEWPLYTGGAARAMLAYLDDHKINHILSTAENDSIAEHALYTHNDYWPLVERIRTKGYNVSYDDVLNGVSSIGAPIFNQHGEVTAAISLSNTSRMIQPKKEEELATLITDTANTISASLGWDGTS